MDQIGKRATFVFGGARSGKSRFAEQLAVRSGLQKFYIATGAAYDDEMADRIDKHRQQRGPSWKTIEEELDLAGVLSREAAADRVLLIDCLTLWLSNLMFAEKSTYAETGRLIESLAEVAGPCIFVSNEVGMGIVPENRLSRSFRDAQGRLNQDIATACDQVVFVAAGQPLLLKPNAQPEITL
ncbi:MAG: bifunctional adenosylcobinamide kinase/adenosylcobinamide-phosphate guanylyltransferase [Roseibium sp.]